MLPTSTNSIAPCSVYKPYTTHNSSIRSDEGLTLETSAFQSLYGGQFTLPTLLINLIFVNCLGHPNNIVRFPSPDRPTFFRKVQKKIPEALVKAANTLIYKYTILFYLQQLVG